MEGDKKRHDDKSIFSPGDVVDKGKGYAGTEPGLRHLKRKTVERAKEGLTGRVAEKAGEAALRRSASRYLGWYGWLMDDVEFGGKKWIKEEVSGTLADYIIQHHKTVCGLNRVIIRILEQINKDLAKLDEIERLEKIYRAAENRAVDAALAVERARQRNVEGWAARRGAGGDSGRKRNDEGEAG